MAIRADGSLAAWGFDYGGLVSGVPAGTNFVHVDVGHDHAIALRSDGSLHCWGSDSYGQISGTPTGTGFVEVTAGQYHSAAVRSDGTLEVWGFNAEDVISDKPAGSGVKQAVAGGYHYLVIREGNAGAGYCFGNGTAAACPCGGFSSAEEGCLNSSGVTGAKLTGTGLASISSDTFQLQVTGIPGNKAGLLFRGSTQLAGGAGNPLASGLYCTGGTSIRSQVQITAGGGTVFSDFLGSAYGASSFGAGGVTNYQLWYRDPANTCSADGYNFSNAWTVTWLP